ncbi:SCurly1-like 3 (S. cerevisiae) [Nesidiocoris tenuis]|uniref:SCurly1-like 3 (S. cerevisiae) n=1 Tax=Nesidiocoris tenuis TaxID=355587 RepID=A0ABN7B9M0_9HEMI|nr:SCurly1-like 3 (S. cerevisiae) [Nesidiocoris tenuis]
MLISYVWSVIFYLPVHLRTFLSRRFVVLNIFVKAALSSHNNICQASIYVTPEGYWKLGGLEFLCRFSDLSARFLADSQQGRYARGISPNEESRIPQPPSAIDQFAFGILIEEVLKSREEDVPGMADFLHVARTQLQSVDCKTRPSIETLLKHSFFNHQFITIHNFLTELPLKNSSQKQAFFRDLPCSLSEFSDEAVASQLGGLLLSRIVMLDPTAQQTLLPRILTPKTCDDSKGLFSEQTFREHISPRLMSIFYVRDIQVRLTLLKYFPMFCDMFTIPQLNSNIIPELLVGVMDVNDELVASTLRALADLVPILGSATVIGGKRAKHFSDGRPKVNDPKSARKAHKPTKTSDRAMSGVFADTASLRSDEPDLFLAERPSPDGGEAPDTQTATTTEDEGDNWDNWDSLPPSINQIDADDILVPQPSTEGFLQTRPVEELQISRPLPSPPDKQDPPLNLPIDKLESLNIQPRKAPTPPQEVDFFSDMVPIISNDHIVVMPTDRRSPPSVVNSKFDAAVSDTEEVGWGDDSDWDEVRNSEF